jgi:hypothetical protein
MSVDIKFTKFKSIGKMTVTSESDYISSENVKARAEALIQAIACFDTEAYGHDPIYQLTEILHDYLPTDEQWEKVFKND